MDRQHLDQAVSEVHAALAAVLRRPDLDVAPPGALHLPRDGQRTAQEVDVTGLDGRGLAEPQARERAERTNARHWPAASSRVARTCPVVGSVVTVALNLLFTELAALGIDAAEWVECKQGEARARLASGERHPSSEALRPWDDDG